ncbi:hypothetical protein [Streptomyces iconiensis]|uniref:ABC transporter permease n=1 Tax=Streptomyces iconiensis TaxID=1384038 RepID=A0ABT7A1H6_9ACTN|nr:hypothetical protein [Streptomyces iconiensis]MDJ1134696.1 hypothetical protein [Streptomyces iconiensis]
MAGNAALAAAHAEWTKVSTVRSTAAALGLTAVLGVVAAAVSGTSMRNALENDSGRVAPGFHPVDAGFDLVWYLQLGLVAFGVLVVAGEFRGGTVRASLAAVPRRGLFYVTKAAVCALVVLPVAALATVAAFLADQAGLGPYGVPVGESFGEEGVVRGMVLGTVHLTLITLFAVGLATLLRSAAVALGVLYVFLFVVSPAVGAIPGGEKVTRFLPDKAGVQALKVGSEADAALGPYGGIGVVAAWTALALVAGWLAFRHREL